MAITLNGTTGITTPDLTSTDDITANSSAVLTAASSLAAANLTGVLPAISGAALTNLPIPASAVTLISTVSPTGVGYIDIALPSGYKRLSLALNNIIYSASGNSSLRVSSNSGSTFETTNYLTSYFMGYGASSLIGSYASYTGVSVTFSASTPTINTSGLVGTVDIYEASNASSWTTFDVNMASWNNANDISTGKSSVIHQVATTINMIRLFNASSSNIIQGNISLYGWT